MITNNKQFIPFIISLLILSICSVIIYTVYINVKFSKYEDITYNTEFEGKIRNKTIYKSGAFFECNNKLYSISFASNDHYRPYYLNEFLENGDILKKNMNTDTVYVIKEGYVYMFILGKNIEIE